jgi:Zn-dependent M28 family amino/carboxypeptidase
MTIARTRRTGWALSLAAILAVAGCQAAPPASPTAPDRTARPAATVGPGSTLPPASPFAGAVAADALRDGIDVDDIMADLARLEEITDEHGGARPAGSDAEAAAAAFVATELRAAGFEVELQSVELPYFRQDAPSALQVLAAGAPPAFEDLRDFKAMLFSAAGDVTGQVYRLGFDPLAQPGGRSGLGCAAAEWAGVPAGVIVLVQPAECRRHDVVVHAQEAGALAIVTAYPEWVRDGVLRPTLVEPADITIPALGATHAVGLALAQAAADGVAVRLSADTAIETRSSVNVIAETPGGDPAHVVMLGGHLDSVLDGPGINDNGSGTMTILEIARELAAGSEGAAWKVRVAFWTGEEIGLWGSGAYVRGLDAARSGAIEAYLNFDMLGSPNGVRLVYDGAGTSRAAEGATVAALFAQAFERSGVVWQAVPLGGSSDHSPFDQAGLVTGGLFSGANEHKTAAQAGLFGGTADAPGDACYHLACDTVDNIDPGLLEEMARAAAWVVGALASGEVALSGS